MSLEGKNGLMVFDETLYQQYNFHHHECSAQEQIFHCKLGNQGCSSAQRQVCHRKLRYQVAVLLGMNKCGNFPLLSSSHSLFSIWTDLKRSEKIPGASMWRWGERIWLTGSSGLHRNSPQGLNISSIGVFWPDQKSGNSNHSSLPSSISNLKWLWESKSLCYFIVS